MVYAPAGARTRVYPGSPRELRSSPLPDGGVVAAAGATLDGEETPDPVAAAGTTPVGSGGTALAGGAGSGAGGGRLAGIAGAVFWTAGTDAAATGAVPVSVEIFSRPAATVSAVWPATGFGVW